jgi:hypothetical protein
MSFRHLRRRLGTKLAAFALIAVSGCMEYSTTAYSGYYESSGYRSYPPYDYFGPPVVGGWYGNRWHNNWGAWPGGRHRHSWHGHRHHWHHGHGSGLHHGGGPWQGRH